MELYWIWGVVVVVGTWNWFESRGTTTPTSFEPCDDEDGITASRFIDDDEDEFVFLDDRYDEVEGFSHHDD